MSASARASEQSAASGRLAAAPLADCTMVLSARAKSATTALMSVRWFARQSSRRLSALSLSVWATRAS